RQGTGPGPHPTPVHPRPTQGPTPTRPTLPRPRVHHPRHLVRSPPPPPLVHRRPHRPDQRPLAMQLAPPPRPRPHLPPPTPPQRRPHLPPTNLTTPPSAAARSTAGVAQVSRNFRATSSRTSLPPGSPMLARMPSPANGRTMIP